MTCQILTPLVSPGRPWYLPGDRLRAMEGTAPPGAAPKPPISQGSATPAVSPTQAGPIESHQEQESAPEEDGEDSPPGAIDISLKDIFEESTEVDEHLKDLADSQDDIRVEDLAGELREFLSELEE